MIPLFVSTVCLHVESSFFSKHCLATLRNCYFFLDIPLLASIKNVQVRLMQYYCIRNRVHLKAITKFNIHFFYLGCIQMSLFPWHIRKFFIVSSFSLAVTRRSLKFYTVHEILLHTSSKFII
jgi:hypothetical protein